MTLVDMSMQLGIYGPSAYRVAYSTDVFWAIKKYGLEDVENIFDFFHRERFYLGARER